MLHVVLPHLSANGRSEALLNIYAYLLLSYIGKVGWTSGQPHPLEFGSMPLAPPGLSQCYRTRGPWVIQRRGCDKRRMKMGGDEVGNRVECRRSKLPMTRKHTIHTLLNDCLRSSRFNLPTRKSPRTKHEERTQNNVTIVNYLVVTSRRFSPIVRNEGIRVHGAVFFGLRL